MPCFPVRLNLELFELAFHRLNRPRLSVYDPCCGSGFSLTTLGMMKQEKIECLYASDVNPACVEAAQCNTAMLTPEGLTSASEKILSNETASPERKKQLTEARTKLLPYLTNHTLRKEVFPHDILESAPQLPQKIDYIFADIPYGNLTEWTNRAGCDNPSLQFLRNIEKILSTKGIVVISGTKELKLPPDSIKNYTKIDKIRAGKRLIYMLELNSQ